MESPSFWLTLQVWRYYYYYYFKAQAIVHFHFAWCLRKLQITLPEIFRPLLGRKLTKIPKPEPEQAEPDFDLVAPPQVAKLQAWNMRVAPLLPKDVAPISLNIRVRTEFSGAGTAEESMAAAAAMWNNQFGDSTRQIRIHCDSIGDWCSAARFACSLNHPHACRFKDILQLAPSKLRAKLQETVHEKAIHVQW